jgi:uncharacterized protein
VTAAEAVALVATGTAAGIVSTVASLASVVSYPVLLALGLPPLTANMTNTVALVFSGTGAAVGSRPELAGQGSRVRRFGVVTAVGGGVGAALLLVTPPGTFERVAPVLIGGASLILLMLPERTARGARGDWLGSAARDGAARDGAGRDGAGGGGAGRSGWRPRRHTAALLAALFCASIYIGYFGAGGGIVMLAAISATLAEPLIRANAVKNVVTGLANLVAAIGFSLFGHVDWAVVPALAAGFLLGGWTGPALVRRLPPRLLRVLIALAGVAIAVKLGLSAYR